MLAFRLRQTDVDLAPGNTSDLLLKIRDLEARRDDLYRRIRSAEEDHLGAAELDALEEAAALTLRELDRLNGQLPKEMTKRRRQGERQAPVAGPPEAAGEPAQAATELPMPGSARAHSPLLTGLAIGAAMVVVVALLVFWAVRDAQPTLPGGQPAPADGSMEPPHEGQVQLPPELAGQIADLQARLAADPEDWLARKQLALTQVAAGQLSEAFSQASTILQRFPDDPDALLVHGIVRLSMGQLSQSVELFDRLLAQYPDHRQALTYRGLALYQMGNIEQAMDTWEVGLEMAGGSDPELEQLLVMAQSGQLPAGGMAPPTAPPSSQPAAPAPDPDGFNLRIDLAAGARIAPGSTLFVFLLTDEEGPPVAVRRLTRPSFPLETSLGPGDSMMGAELPTTGTLVARLDTDGNVATTADSDLSVAVTATKGELAHLTLGH